MHEWTEIEMYEIKEWLKSRSIRDSEKVYQPE